MTMKNFFNKLMLILLCFSIGAFSKVAENSWTFLIYMNGSNLESRNQFATKNINSMLSAKPENENINVVILTGGTKEWHSQDISQDSITYSVINNKGFQKLRSLENTSIADSVVLADFIAYGKNNFPAERYALIFWNHGTGAATGFGFDELFDKKTMSLAELRSGIKNGIGKSDKNFSFIGFDACLMASVELAISLSPFGDYLIASQELEPGNGWDYYTLLKTLNKQPNIGTDSLCIEIIDSYIDFYTEKDKSLQRLTLSAINLRKISDLKHSINQISQKILSEIALNSLIEARAKSNVFGQPVFSAYSYDMIDILSFFEGFSKYFPQEWQKLKYALGNAVLHNRVLGLDETKASGLSVYFPYDNKKTMVNLGEYYRLENMENYMGLVRSFIDSISTKKPEIIISDSTNVLTAEILLKTRIIYSMLFRKEDDGRLALLGYDSDGIKIDGEMIWNNEWITIGGDFVCVYERLANIDILHYAVPALVNNEKVFLIVIYDDANPGGAIYGFRKEMENNIPSRGYERIKGGDNIAFLYPIFDKNTMQESGEYAKGPTFTAITKGQIKVNIAEVPQKKYVQIFCLVDIYGNKHYIGKEKLF